MLHTFRTNRAFQNRIEAELAAIKEHLDASQVATIEVKTLGTDPADAQHGGSKPLLKFNGDDGKAYLFKQCDPALAAAEEAAYQLRRLGGRPAVPVRATSARLGDIEAPGTIKAFIEADTDDLLDPDTTQWSLEQRSVMLLEHAWEWFLDNMDTNTTQYVLLGPLKLPINIDWDRSFYSAGTSELSRFVKYRATLPNARTFLYADYVAGKTKLPLWLLSREARRIRRLPRERVRAILMRFARVRFETDAEREQFVARMMMRRHGIEREVGTFMRELWAERKSLETPPDGLRELVHHKLLLAWAHWQLVLNHLSRGPIGQWARRALSSARWLKTRARLREEATPGSQGGASA